MNSTPTTAVGSAEARAFAAMEDGFRRARDRASISRCLRLAVGGGSVAIEVVGNRLFEQLTPALAHLAVEEDGRAPDLSVSLWDADESGIAVPPPAPGDDPTARAIVSASNDGRFVLQRRTHAVVGQDRARRAVVGWFRDVDRLPLYDRGRPLHPQLLLWNQDRGAPPLHAGLVARAGRGALFVGEGGSGKSTSTLTCLLHGFDFLGDDYVSLSKDGRGGFAGHGVYGSTHVDPDHLARFPELHARAVHPLWENEDKAVVFLADVLPERLARESPIDALFLPTVKSGRTSVRPATPAQALLRLVQGALALAPHAGSGGMEPLFELAASVPAYWLDLGADLDEIPLTVARTLDALPR
ncbi:MAG: hypothetical protein ACREK2_10210 [Gemmatimonadota bacterium]